MTLREEIQDGQHRANEIIRKVKLEIDNFDNQSVALSTFKAELMEQLKKLLDKK